MATIDGKVFQLGASITNEDGSGGKVNSSEAVTDKFELTGGVTLPVEETDWFRSTDESGRTTDFEEGAPTPIAVGITKDFTMKLSEHSAGFWTAWAMNNGAVEAYTPTLVSGSAATVYEHSATGRDNQVPFIAPTLYTIGDPAALTDGQRNRIVHNALVERLEISGQRKGLLNLTVGIRGGGSTSTLTGTEETDYNALSFNDQQLLHFGMSHLFTNATLGENVANDEAVAFTTTTATTYTDAAMLAQSNLVASGAESLTSQIQSWALRFNNTVNDQESYAPGQLNSTDAGIVPDSLDWVSAPSGSATCELEMVFTHTAAATQEGFIDEVRAGTRRAFELWVVPGIAAEVNGDASNTDAYRGLRITFFEMHPVSWEEVENQFGAKKIRVVYRPGYNSSAGAVWRYNAAWDESTAVGA